MRRAEGKVELRWKFDVGKPFFEEITRHTNQTMKVMDMEVNQQQHQVFYLQWTPEVVDERGHWLLGMKIIGAKIDIDIGGNRIVADSTKPALPVLEARTVGLMGSPLGQGPFLEAA